MIVEYILHAYGLDQIFKGLLTGDTFIEGQNTPPGQLNDKNDTDGSIIDQLIGRIGLPRVSAVVFKYN
jgi:hypothetical protein